MIEETTMTIDELGAIVANSILELQKSMKQMERRLNKRMDTKFAHSEQKMNAKFAYLEQKMDKGFGDVNLRIDKVVSVHDSHSSRIKALELKTS